MDKNKYFQIVSPPFACGLTWLINVLHELNIKTTNQNFKDNQWTSMDNEQFILNNDAHALLKHYFPSFNENKTFKFSDSIEIFWEHRLDFANHFDRPTILFVRDPRDAIHSLYKRNYEKLFNFDDYLIRPDQWPHHFPNLFNLPPSETISIFTLFWLEMSKFMPIIVVKFEDTKTNPQREIKKVLDFLKISRSSEEIEKAIEASSFQNMKNKIDKLTTDKDLQFKTLRKGQINEWKNTYTAKQLNYFSSQPVVDCYGKMLNYNFINNTNDQSAYTKIKSSIFCAKNKQKILAIATKWTNEIFFQDHQNLNSLEHMKHFFVDFLKKYNQTQSINNLICLNNLDASPLITAKFRHNLIFCSGYFFAVPFSLGAVDLTIGITNLKNKYQHKILFDKSLAELKKKLLKKIFNASKDYNEIL